MAITGASSTVSADISALAVRLMAKERLPLQTLQRQRDTLDQRSTILGTLKTKMLALKSTLDNLISPGTLSPFAGKTASSSDTSVLTVSSSTAAASGAISVAVSRMAKSSTHVSNLYSDSGTTISDGGTGTFGFSVTVGSKTYDASVTINGGDTDATVLNNVASAINTAVGADASATKIQTATGQSRLSIASTNTGTANKISLTDTDGLLARVGLYHASPTAASDTNGGYIYEDLGGHELDAVTVVNGITVYRDSNTISDIVPGVTFTLKNTSATTITVKIQPDADLALSNLKDFIAKYNDVIDYLAQNTAVDPKAGTIAPLALDPVFSTLRGQLRAKEIGIVGSQAAGTANSLAALGIRAGSDGKLSVTDESALRNTFSTNPSAVASLFNAADGVATTLNAFVKNYSSYNGQIVTSQNQLSGRMSMFDLQITRTQERLARRQSQLEQQLAQGQAMLTRLNSQANQMTAITNAYAQMLGLK